MSRVRLKHRIEYAGVLAAAIPCRHLPYPAALAFAWCLAWLAHRLVRFRAAEARRRIRAVFGPALPEREVRRIAWRAWRNFVFSIVDMIRLDRVTPAWLDRYSRDWRDVAATLNRGRRDGRGMVIACAHSGAWTTAGVAMQRAGLPVFFFAAQQKNPLADAFWDRLMSATGIATLKRGRISLRSVVRRLESGEVLAILPDVRLRTPGVRVPFLGGEANVPAGPALFACHAGVPLCPTFPIRLGWRQHSILTGPPVAPDPALTRPDNCARMLRAVLAWFDERIRAQPDQWFWYNKRWILEPLNEDGRSA